MKKVFVCLCLVLFLCSCTYDSQVTKPNPSSSGVWISYYELNSMLKSDNDFKAEFSKVIENCKSLAIKNLYIHTRAFGETLYTSDYFPQTPASEPYDYDVFGYIVEECHKAGLLVYAWINPYRVSSDTDIESLNAKSPAYKWLKDENADNDSNVCIEGGIYFNPASAEVQALILDGIRELAARYDIDGIHFDDYFYPTQKASFDSDTYEKYKNGTQNALSLECWRRENVNLLISSVYSTVKYVNKDIIFSISPAASIDHNYENLYADVSLWIEQGWLDEIIPQVYFGFEYPDKAFCFDNLVDEWKVLAAQNPDILLKVGLACYKAVPDLEADKAEWENNGDIIARQVELCDKDSKISGWVYFSYSSLFGEGDKYRTQRQNVLEYLKREKTNE